MKRVKAALHDILTLDVSTKKLALACAIGIWIGFSPYLGLHTLMAVLASSILRLPIYPILIGAHTVNPFTIPFIYTFTTAVGSTLLGTDLNINLQWDNITLKELWETQKSLLLPFWLGTHVVGAALSIFTYPIVYYIVRGYRRENSESNLWQR
ncbi:MAG: DUF2062 domain-containing protein [Deferribacteraceae bacterium]|nr:DUF2062 domain-containing protein [Deferribacteraceae bacterium]